MKGSVIRSCEDWPNIGHYNPLQDYILCQIDTHTDKTAVSKWEGLAMHQLSIMGLCRIFFCPVLITHSWARCLTSKLLHSRNHCYMHSSRAALPILVIHGLHFKNVQQNMYFFLNEGKKHKNRQINHWKSQQQHFKNYTCIKTKKKLWRM